MLEVDKLLELTKSISTTAGLRLLDRLSPEHKKYIYSDYHPREIKALADTVLEEEILQISYPNGTSNFERGVWLYRRSARIPILVYC